MSATVHGAIAAGDAQTAEAGIDMFRQGGNVFDAVLAAVLAASVVESTLTSLGGGGFLLAHTHTNQNILFDFFTQTPRRKRNPAEVSFYPVTVNFGSVTQEFHIGLGSVAVPGTVAGLFYIHQRLGRLPFRAIAEPAIHYAKTGVEIQAFQAYCLNILKPILLKCPEMRTVYAGSGQLLQAGDRLTMPSFAETLAYLVEAGPRAFYEGEIAQRMVNDCRDQGGYLTAEDLASYRVIERKPLTANYRGNTLLTNPPPSSGGSLIAFSLALLSQLDLASMGFGTTEHLTALARVMQLTNGARADGYDRRLYESDVAERFLSGEHLQRYACQLTGATNKWGSTTHISAIDSDGNAASVTTSNGEGSSYTIPGTGIMLNNMLGEADLHPSGFHQWQEDVRISSMMAPTIVLRDRLPEIVLGSGGSNRIRTAVLQVISNIIDFNMSVEEAVNSPRVHWENGVFNVEPGFPHLHVDEQQFPFNESFVMWNQPNMFFGGVHTVMESAEGVILGGGDRRRYGVVATI